MRLSKIIIASFLCAFAPLSHSCRKQSAGGKSDSGLTSVKLGLPDNKASDGTVLFDRYGIEVSTTDSACKDYELVNSDAANGEVLLNDIVLKNACSYSIVLKLGKTDQVIEQKAAKGNGKTLNDKATYSNIVNGASAKVVSSDELSKSNGTLPITIKVYKADKNSPGPEEIKTPETTNLSIDITLGGASGPMLKSNQQWSITSDEHFKKILNGYAGQRFIVQFSMNLATTKCDPCNAQTAWTREFLKTAPADGKTVFLLYDIINDKNPTIGNNVWGLSNRYPETFVFEKGQQIKPAAISGNESYTTKVEELKKIFNSAYNP